MATRAKGRRPAPARRPRRQPARQPAQPPARQLEAFIAEYTPDIAAVAREALTKLRARFAGTSELVYENYNALAIGWSPTGKAGDVICSIALYPRWVSLFFLRGATLPDPHGRLRGAGKVVRHVVLAAGARTLDEPAIRDLIAEAIARSPRPTAAGASPGPIIKAISPKRRPRRPR